MRDLYVSTTDDATPSTRELFMGAGLRYFGQAYRISLADYAAQVTPWTTHLVELSRPYHDRRGVTWEPAPDLPAHRIDVLDPSGDVVVLLRLPFRKAGRASSPPRKPRQADDDSDE